MPSAGDVSVFIRAVDKTKAAVQSAERGFKRLTDKLKAMSKLQVAALGGVLFSLNRFVKAFEAQEQAEARLRAAIANVKTASQGAADELIRYAEALQKVTAFGDEQIISAEGMLATFQLNEDQIKQIIPRLLDMAAAVEKTSGRSVDLEQIAIALGKAFTGQVGLLARYGVVLDENAIKTEGFAGILKSLDMNFKGMAQTVAQTETGALRQLKNILGDLAEDIGRVILEAIMPFIQVLKGIVSAFRELPDSVKRTVVMFGVLATVIKTLGFQLAIFSPGGAILAGLSILIGTIITLQKETKTWQDRVSDLRKEYEGLTKEQLQAELIKAQLELNNLLDKMAEKPSLMKAAWAELKNLIINGFQPGITAINKELFAQNEQYDIITAKIQALRDVLNGIGSQQHTITQQTQEEFELRQQMLELEQTRQEIMQAAFEKANEVEQTRREESAQRVEELFQQQLKGWDETATKALQTYGKQDKALNDYANSVRKQQENQEQKSNQFINTFRYGLSNIIAGQAIAQIDAAWERSFGRARSVLQQFIQFALQQLARLAAQRLAFTILKAISGPFGFLPFSRGGILIEQSSPVSFNRGGTLAAQSDVSFSNRGSFITAQEGLMPLAVGADTVPVLATPGEAIVPRQVVRENRQAVQQLITQQTINNNQSQAVNQTVELHVSIQAWDGIDVMRAVRSNDFKRAFRELISGGQLQIKIGKQLAEVK